MSYSSSETTWNLFIVAATSAKIKARRRLALIIQRKLWRTTNKKPGVRKKLARGHIKKKLPVKGKIEIKQEDGEVKPTEGKKKAILVKVKTEPGEELKKESPSTKYTGKKGQPKHKKQIKEVCLGFFVFDYYCYRRYHDTLKSKTFGRSTNPGDIRKFFRP